MPEVGNFHLRSQKNSPLWAIYDQKTPKKSSSMGAKFLKKENESITRYKDKLAYCFHAKTRGLASEIGWVETSRKFRFCR